MLSTFRTWSAISMVMMLPMLSCCLTPWLPLQLPASLNSTLSELCSCADVLDTTGQPVSFVICCWFKHIVCSLSDLWNCSWYCCCCWSEPPYCCTVKVALAYVAILTIVVLFTFSPCLSLARAVLGTRPPGLVEGSGWDSAHSVAPHHSPSRWPLQSSSFATARLVAAFRSGGHSVSTALHTAMHCTSRCHCRSCTDQR